MTLSRNFQKIALVSVSLIGLMGFVDAASAKTWQQTHPRRAEVNDRLHNQIDRIAKQEFNGNLSPAEAAKLLHEDNQVRSEERAMAGLNNSHITKAEQKALNQQENQISKQIP
jgi:hypothetical protein